MPKYRFDEIAINSTEKKKPTETDKETYIGLEHLDSGILEVTRWGAEVAPVGDKLVMRKGDILFGRRRAYQKKVAIAPFDGIFSAHGMVLRPIETVISKEFFPFFISSDYFLDAAIQISVGSLSPTINWRDLCKLEFEIPTIEEQRELSPILWGMNRLKAAYSNLLQQMDALVQSQLVEMFGDYRPGTIQWPEYTLQKLIDMEWITYHLDGNHGGEYPRVDEFVDSGVPYISANCIIDGAVSFSNAKYVTDERSKRFRKGIAQNNDVLFAHNATVGPVAILKTEVPTVILGTSLTAFRCDMHSLIPEYLKAYLENPYFVRQYEGEMQQSTRKQVPITTQRKYTIVVPDLEVQERFSCFIHQIDKSKFTCALQEKMLNVASKVSIPYGNMIQSY